MKRLFCLLILLFLFPCICFAEEDTLTVRFLDVGQGDAAIIQCGGKSLMIDGGDRDSNQFLYSFLKDLKLDTLDYIIATHPHDDHVKGLAAALVLCDAGTIFSPVTQYDGDGFRDFQKKLKERKKTLIIPHRGDTFQLGKAAVTFLTEPQPEWDPNDQSLMVKITFGNTAFLFTGDAAWEAEQDALGSGLDLKADVLKIGHHGSAASTSPAFLDAVRPAYAILSVGEKNDYGHPARETLLKLQHRNISVFRTDVHGTITCISNGKTIAFEMTKKNRKW